MTETTETETAGKETRGRLSKTISFVCRLPVSDHSALMALTLKRMKQSGEDIPRDVIISEAIQAYNKNQSAGE